MVKGRSILPLAGAAVTGLLAISVGQSQGHALSARLAERSGAALQAIGAHGVTASFETGNGWATRHPQLSGGNRLKVAVRARAAQAVADVPGVGGVRWSNSSVLAAGLAALPRPLHCQDDVEALLQARTIRFEESSAQIDRTSQGLIDEVAAALRPCLGSIIAITGHTDSSGDAAGNLALSRKRADAVRRALTSRGIPADGLRATGVGSARPVDGLDPADPANRRIEFSVIETVPVRPTPVDTPAPR